MRRTPPRQLLALLFAAAATLGFVVPRFALAGAERSRQEILRLEPAGESAASPTLSAGLIARPDGGIDLDIRDEHGVRVGLIRYTEVP